MDDSTKTDMANVFDRLPLELRCYILEQLAMEEAVRLRIVCRALYHGANSLFAKTSYCTEQLDVLRAAAGIELLAESLNHAAREEWEDMSSERDFLLAQPRLYRIRCQIQTYLAMFFQDERMTRHLMADIGGSQCRDPDRKARRDKLDELRSTSLDQLKAGDWKANMRTISQFISHSESIANSFQPYPNATVPYFVPGEIFDFTALLRMYELEPEDIVVRADGAAIDLHAKPGTRERIELPRNHLVDHDADVQEMLDPWRDWHGQQVLEQQVSVNLWLV